MGKNARKRRIKTIIPQFYAAPLVFCNPKLLIKLRELEKELAENLSDQSIDTILQQFGYRREVIYRCHYGLSDEARLKVLKCGYYSYDKKILDIKEPRTMEDVIKLGEQAEEEILGSVMMMLGTIKRFRRMGKI